MRLPLTALAVLAFASTQASAAAPSQAWYPPIQVTLNVHGHNYHYDQSPDAPCLVEQRTAEYLEQRLELMWLASVADAYGAKLSVQLNGEYAQDAIDRDDTDHLTWLESQGHTLSTHFHWSYYDESVPAWVQFDRRDPSTDEVGETWADHLAFVEEAIGHPVHRVDPGVDADVLNDLLSALYGLSVETVSDVFSYARFNTKPFTPFRRQLFTALDENLAGPMIAIPTFGQIGADEPLGLHAVHTTVPQLQRHFLMVVAEWRERRRRGLTPKVFSFGTMTHFDQNADHHEDVLALVSWLADWSERLIDGKQVSGFASDLELHSTFETWEKYYPGESSFSYEYELPLDPNWDAEWPYLLEGLVVGLRDAEFDEELLTWESQGVVVMRLDRRLIIRGPANPSGQQPMVPTDILGEPIYLMWSDTGADVSVDFRSEQPGVLQVTDGESGATTNVTAQGLVVTPQPMLVEAAP